MLNLFRIASSMHASQAKQCSGFTRMLSAALLNVCPHEQEHQERTKMMSQRKNDLKTPQKSRDRTVNNMRSADEHPRCHDGDASRRFL